MDHLPLPDSTDPTHLENLWSEDNSRSRNLNATTTATTTSTSSTTTTSSESPIKVRRRRSTSKSQNIDKYLENILQSLEYLSDHQTSTNNYPTNIWSNTPCSKRIFCEEMLAQPEDSVSLMDKKIYTFLSL